MSQNNRYMAVSVTEPKADTKRPKVGGQSHGTSVQDANVAALERELAIYKRDSGIEMEELRAKVNNMPKGGGAGEPGKDGVGIESVEQTVVSEESGGENKVEITLTDGQKTEVVIRNGKDGKDGEGGGEGGNVTPESIGAVQSKAHDTIGTNTTIADTICNYAAKGVYSGQFQAADNVSDNPEPNWAFAIEFVNAGGDTVCIRAHKLYTDIVYIRQINIASGQYMSNWAMFYSTGNKPTAADVGAVKKSGDTMTGQLTVPLLRVSNFSQPIEIGKYIDMHKPDSPDDDFSVRLIADGDTLKMQRKGVGALDVFYHTGNKPTADAVGALKRGSYERIQGTAEAHKNLNDYVLPGFYNVKTAYVDNCPAGIGIDAVLLVYPWNDNIYNMQEITETAASPMCRRWTRHSNAGTWTAWKAVITEDSKNLVTAADVGAFGQLGNYSNLISDLNEFKSIGAIYITSAKANQPTNTSPYATVWNIAGYGSTYMTQHFFDAVSKNMYYRGYVDGVWGAWKQIATTDYIDEQILKGEW